MKLFQIKMKDGRGNAATYLLMKESETQAVRRAHILFLNEFGFEAPDMAIMVSPMEIKDGELKLSTDQK